MKVRKGYEGVVVSVGMMLAAAILFVVYRLVAG